MLMDVDEKSNQNSYKKIDVGFCTESAPRDARTNAFFDLVTWPSVEWGYSVNKEIEVENLLEHSLVA